MYIWVVSNVNHQQKRLSEEKHSLPVRFQAAADKESLRQGLMPRKDLGSWKPRLGHDGWASVRRAEGASETRSFVLSRDDVIKRNRGWMCP